MTERPPTADAAQDSRKLMPSAPPAVRGYSTFKTRRGGQAHQIAVTLLETRKRKLRQDYCKHTVSTL